MSRRSESLVPGLGRHHEDAVFIQSGGWWTSGHSSRYCRHLYFVLGRIVVPSLDNPIKGWRVWVGEQSRTFCQWYLSTSILEARGCQILCCKLHGSFCNFSIFTWSRNEVETRRFNYTIALQEIYQTPSDMTVFSINMTGRPPKTESQKVFDRSTRIAKGPFKDVTDIPQMKRNFHRTSFGPLSEP